MILAWCLFLLYAAVTLWLSWLGSRRTNNLRSFALGDGRMSPWVVGMALAASMTSTATFVINPGIVYAYGLSAVLGYGLAAGLGLTVGIVVLSKGFRRHGAVSGALTVPQWIGERWGERLRPFYAVVNLLLLAMVVLICYAMAGLLVATLRLGDLVGPRAFEVALALVIAFVFSYVFFGGTYAHAYTNTVQGLVMVAVAVTLIASGWHLVWDGGLLERLAAIDPSLATATNPGSILFRNLFEVFGVNLLVGFSLALQPHFLIKSLYVESDRQVNQYLGLAVGVGVLFNLVLLCGLYARIDAGPAVAAYIAEHGLGIDGVMPAYIVHTFSPTVGVIVSIALLAAGMSTLDGILVALSAILANDLYLPLTGRRADDPETARVAFAVSRWGLVAFGLIAFVLSLLQHYHKDFSVAIFAQEGVYALFAATFVPMLFGIFGWRLPTFGVLGASLVALGVHFFFRYSGVTLLTAADGTNPGLTATYGLIASVLFALGSRPFAPKPFATKPVAAKTSGRNS